MRVQTKDKEIAAALRKAATRLEADLVGTRSALRLEQEEHERTEAKWREAEADARRWAGVADEHRAEVTALRARLDRRAAEVLSDAELHALAAEVQAELTAVPATAARERLRAALRARGVLVTPTAHGPWRAEGVASTGPAFIARKISDAEKP